MESNHKWHRMLLRAGKKSSIFLFIFIFVFSGFGYLFINQSQIAYFDKKVNFNQHVIQTFYDGNNGKYLVEIGKETEAEKHGIVLSSDYIKKYLEKMPQFQKDGKFNKTVFEEFIKNKKLTQYDIWQYAKQQAIIEVFYNMISNCPNEFSLIEKIGKNQKTIDSVSGIQYFIKDEIIEKKVDEQLQKMTTQDLINFIKQQTKKVSYSFINPEYRSGFLIEIPNKKISDFSQNKIEEVIKAHPNQKNAKEKMKAILGLDINIIPINKTPRTTGIEDMIFESIDFYELSKSVFIPIVEEIIPITAKKLTAEDVEIIKKEYRHELFGKCASLYALELSNMLNNGIITEKDLVAISTQKNFVKSLHDATTTELSLLVVDVNKSIVLHTYESKIGIFVCKSKNFKNISTMFSQLKAANINISPYVLKSSIDNFLTYWIYHFENQG